MLEKKVIREWCISNGCGYHFYGDEPLIIILGEGYAKFQHHEEQEEIIEQAKPDYLLHEFLGARRYDPGVKRHTFLEGVPVNCIDDFELSDKSLSEDKHVMAWAEKYGFIAIGIDLSYAELDIVEKEIHRKYPEYICTTESPIEVIYRERRMGNRIVEYQPKITKPLVVVMEAHHIRPLSQIHRILKRESITYVCINQDRER